jgi:hypothetical protein
MLVWKAWRDSRGRFAIGAALIAALCIVLVGFEAELRRRMVTPHPLTFDAYVYSRIYAGLVRTVFMILAVVLGLRGREVLGFTLALPVRRIDLSTSRACVGLVEISVLAAIPAVLVPLCAALAGETYPCTQTLEFAMLWAGGGVLLFATGMVVSAVVHNEYAAIALAVVAVRLLPGPLGLDRAMSGRGMTYFDAHTSLLVGSTPWLVILTIAALSCALLALAAWITARERLS